MFSYCHVFVILQGSDASDSDSNGERLSGEDSSDEENSDRSMDDNLDYYKNHELEDEDDLPPSDEESYEPTL